MDFALAALTFGLVAGLKPGPLGVLVIHETMAKGNLQGFMASLAPLLTDGPIIVLALLLTLQLNDLNWFISIISIIGSAYLVRISYQILRSPNSINPISQVDSKASLVAAVKINFLNPAPYIFWLTIGTSYILMGSELEVVIFIACALLSLCATKFIVAVTIKNLGEKFSPKVYATILKSLSLPLLLFSAQLLYSGVTAWI
tara:strand:- start:25739 stop:26341 length:603 start_codon:yes stop_codon:yes gene_type:complete